MTLDEVLAAKAANQQVSYNGHPVTIDKAGPQMIWVTGANGAKIRVTPEQLSPLP